MARGAALRTAGRVILAACAAGCAVLAYLFVTLPDVRPLRGTSPPTTAFIELRAREARARGKTPRRVQSWVPYSRISPMLTKAVLVTEDDAFWQHEGIDFEQIRESLETNLKKGSFARGASTITQQLAKNLFLGDGRTLTRKLTEVFLALRMERALSKRRIFELYLNLIEWGDGIYGAEAAARRYFGVSAADLSPRQALLLAAVIINPRRYSVLDPPRRIERRVRMIASRMRRRGALDEAQYQEALGLPPPALPPALIEAPVDSTPDSSGVPLSPPATP